MRFTRFGFVMVLAACGVDDHLGPTRLQPPAPHQASLVPPASAYVGTAYPYEGNFNDINDQGLVVGMASFRAVAMKLGGPMQFMASGSRFQDAEANAVNAHGMIVGTVYKGLWLNSDGSPAIWSNASVQPFVLKELGSAADVNDAGLVVGTVYRNGLSAGFAWDSVTRTFALLTPLRRGKQTAAVAVNNDRVILGNSEDGAGGWVSVLWQYNGFAWVPRAMQGIEGLDIDHGYGVVGRAGNQAAYGFPDFSGYLATTPFGSSASSVAGNGLIGGFDPGASLGWPSYGRGFVADRHGAISYMPDPVGGTWWRRSEVRAVNSCGVAVGYDWPFPAPTFTQQPVVWDPGC